MEEKRTGARRISEIPKEILRKLNKGEIYTANLVEWLAVNQIELLQHFLKANDRTHYFKPINTDINNLKQQSVNTIGVAIGEGLCTAAYLNKDLELIDLLTKHTSDITRGWGAYAIGRDTNLTLAKMLNQIMPLAADDHYSVRELAWMAARPAIANELTKALPVLEKWSLNKDKNIRRFASEVTRPRGVWCAHIAALKKQPELAENILQNLIIDEEKYVKDSIGNWLNDASKTRPDFTIYFCNKWNNKNATPHTKYIIKKALRTINKQVE